jgi:hypothetical protein
VRDRVVEVLHAPMSWSFGEKRYALEPSTMVGINVGRVVDSVLARPDRTTLLERVYRRVVDEPIEVRARVPVALNRAKLRAWVSQTAKQVRLDPVDSKLSVHGNALRISASRVGYKLDTKRAEAGLSKALLTGRRDVKLPILPVKPKVTEKSFGQALLVHLDQRKVYLFEGTRFVKSYSIAVGQPGYPTPQGWYHVISKDEWPTWFNPHSGWSSGMPDTIPGGPGNPLGSREIAIDASGIRFHGTSDDGSIGTAASHGCMRMHEWDVQDLYPRVKVGARVIIVP